MATIEEAVEKYYPVAENMSHGDPDLQQELILSAIDSVVNRGIADRGLVLAQMGQQKRRYLAGYLLVDKYGSSIDNGDAKRRKGVRIVAYHTTDEFYLDEILQTDASRMMGWPVNPEEAALFKVDYEKFLSSLSVKELHYWNAKLAGMTWAEIDKNVAHRSIQHGLKMSIRRKFGQYFEVGNGMGY